MKFEHAKDALCVITLWLLKFAKLIWTKCSMI